MVKIHTLANGATVISTSPGHGFKFSDGTQAEPQDREVCDRLTLFRSTRKVRTVYGMNINEQVMVLSEDQQEFLHQLSDLADLVIVPFPVIAALKEQGIRSEFMKVVAMNATQETQRSAPQDKIVDINNWSW